MAFVPHHYEWQPGQAQTAAAGGVDRRSAKNADRPHGSIARSAPSARPLHSPKGGQLGHSETIHEATRRSPVTAMIQPSGPPRSHARVGMTLPPTARSVGMGLLTREARDVLSYRYATSPESGNTG